MRKIRPVIQHYGWGEKAFLPELFGLEQDGLPWAEAWYGSHPFGHATFEDGSLLPETPFLIKIMSIAQPLSIQVHPSAEQALEGFVRENDRGIPLDAPQRNYKDDRAKPESIVALAGGLEARAGLRSAEELDAIIGAIGSKMLQYLWRSDEVQQDTPRMLNTILTLPNDKLSALICDTLVSGEEHNFHAFSSADAYWTKRCSDLYGYDRGVMVQLLMNYVRLDPSDALDMPAGVLHAYLRGRGIEIMNASDNVLRAGLTPKHVDVAHLQEITDFRPRPAAITWQPERIVETHGAYQLDIVKGRTDLHLSSDAVAVCIGRCQMNDVVINHGEAVFIEDRTISAHQFDGTLYVASQL
jgi:mannose-6-phosphate isomerase